MYFGYGAPRCIDLSLGRNHEDWVYVQQDQQYLVAVTATTIQLWASGIHRIRLSAVDCSSEPTHGVNIQAHWCSSRSILAVLTDNGFLNLYHVHAIQEPALSAFNIREPTKATLYLRQSVLVDSAARPTCLAGDGKVLLVGCEDGSIQIMSWMGKVRDVILPTYICDDGTVMSLGPLSSMHYCDKSRLVALVLTSGAVAMLSAAAASGVNQIRELEFSHWVCYGGARCARIGSAAQLLAIGTDQGKVALHRLHPPGSQGSPDWGYSATTAAAGGDGYGQEGGCDVPIRQLCMEPLGHPVTQTGPITMVEWSPDGRVIAAGYHSGGVVVWTPSGCRLFSSLRQGPRPAFLMAHPQTPPATGATALQTIISTGAASGNPSTEQLTINAPQQGDEIATQASALSPSAFSDPMFQLAMQTSVVPSISELGPYVSAGGATSLPGVNTASTIPPFSMGGVTGYLEGSRYGAVCGMAWGPGGYALIIAHTGGCASLAEQQFVQCLPHHHRVAHAPYDSGVLRGQYSTQQQAEELHVLQAHDRLLFITENVHARAGGLQNAGISPMADDQRSLDGVTVNANQSHGNDLNVTHLTLPSQYISSNWPVRHVAVNANGIDVAVAGRTGLALYSRALDKWRLFGDVTQERRVQACAVGWVGNVVVACTRADTTAGGSSWTGRRFGAATRSRTNEPAATDPHQLLLFPKHHLDFTSLMCRFPLAQQPLAMDCVGQYIVLAFEGMDIALFEVQVQGEVKASSRPTATLHIVRDMSIQEVGRPLLGITLVQYRRQLSEQQQLASMGGYAPAAGNPIHSSSNNVITSAGGNAASQQQQASTSAEQQPQPAIMDDAPVAPTQCVIHRWGGLLSVLDLERGSEVILGNEIEAYWISDCSPAVVASTSQLSFSHAQSLALEQQGSIMSSHGSLNTMHSTSMFGNNSNALEEYQGPREVDLPWWGYGPQGMQLWFTSTWHQSLPKHLQQASTAGSANSGGGGGAGSGSYHHSRNVSFSHFLPHHQAEFGAAPGLMASAAQPATQLALPGNLVTLPGGNQQYQDLELEFDVEVYPVGISLADASVVGITQRVVRPPPAPRPPTHASSTAGGANTLTNTPTFHLIPESQPVLPCLLRRLLLRGAVPEAISLAVRHSNGPHFYRSMEWLLFTALEAAADKSQPQGKPLLARAAALLRSFPALHAECVVAVARKTDISLWPHLFDAVGSPGAVLDGLLERNRLEAAANMLLVVDSMEGPEPAYSKAVRMLQVTLARGQYSLASELLRFILYPNDQDEIDMYEEEQASTAAARKDVAASGNAAASQDAADNTQNSIAGKLQEQTSWNDGGVRRTSSLRSAASGGGGGWGSWLGLGWLFGYRAAHAPLQTSHSNTSQPDTAIAARKSVEVTSRGGADKSTAGRAGKESSPGTRQRPTTPHSAAVLSHHAAAARRVIVEHAWGLVGQGRLVPLLQLAACMTFLPGGLVQLMKSRAQAGIVQGRGSVRITPKPSAQLPASPQYASETSNVNDSPFNHDYTPTQHRSSRTNPLHPESTAVIHESWAFAAAKAANASGIIPTDQLAALQITEQSTLATLASQTSVNTVSSIDLLSTLSLAIQQFPVWQGSQYEDDARAVQELLSGLTHISSARVWSLALAILLMDVEPLQEYASQQMEEWCNFLSIVQHDKTFAYLHGVIAMLAEETGVATAEPSLPATPREVSESLDV